MKGDETAKLQGNRRQITKKKRIGKIDGRGVGEEGDEVRETIGKNSQQYVRRTERRNNEKQRAVNSNHPPEKMELNKSCDLSSICRHSCVKTSQKGMRAMRFGSMDRAQSEARFRQPAPPLGLPQTIKTSFYSRAKIPTWKQWLKSPLKN